MAKRTVSVPIDQALRQFLEAKAHAEDRSLAGQIRHLLAEAARQAASEREAA